MFRSILDYRLLKKHQLKSSEEEIMAFQFKAIKKIYKHAIKHSAFYRALYKDTKIENLTDFCKLPTIDKTIMMDHFSTLNTVGIEKEDVLHYALKKEASRDYLGYYQNKFVIGLSSGTSGNKGIFVTPKSMTKRLPAVFLARSGLSLKELPFRILFMLRVFSQGFDDINAPLIKLKYLSTMTPIDEIIETMNSCKINILMAPPSLIRMLLPKVDKIKVSFKKIITYAEVLNEIDKVQFEKVFKTKVIEIYQASEGQMASACPHGYLHINEDLVYVELYDEHQQLITKPGIIGQEMIITNLINYAQPLIRYKMNDMVVLDDTCTCGSSFRRIKSVLGRSDDVIYFYNDKQEITPLFPDLFSRFIITFSDDIREFQVIQNTIGSVDITLDVIHNIKIDQFTAHLQKQMSEYHLNGYIDVKIEKIGLPENNQKYKRFINLSKQS
jgi:putative adenylate-forming enzyme